MWCNQSKLMETIIYLETQNLLLTLVPTVQHHINLCSVGFDLIFIQNSLFERTNSTLNLLFIHILELQRSVVIKRNRTYGSNFFRQYYSFTIANFFISMVHIFIFGNVYLSLPKISNHNCNQYLLDLMVMFPAWSFYLFLIFQLYKLDNNLQTGKQ